MAKVRLLTAKEEKFAQLVVELGDQSAAYRKAYNSKAKSQTVNVNASKLANSTIVAPRIKQLREELRIARRATLDDILDELDHNRKVAEDLAQPSAMNQATLGKAKILGFEKQVIDHQSSDGSMSPRDIDKTLVSALVKKLTD